VAAKLGDQRQGVDLLVRRVVQNVDAHETSPGHPSPIWELESVTCRGRIVWGVLPRRDAGAGVLGVVVARPPRVDCMLYCSYARK
jgi:hypothetical protein